ncbi:hypothetical protein CC86DRAFT_311544 [Ophiobolus disseminans]|uniref:Uncharacterized protein n=1 Tax=Ophiobolus disseminans TaxID=1469910 RepID=A0A6A7AJZ1_9PLEO|nr:hypothetical protein CC86DRAFT_311544 [Ophiobolus disseminans]
MSIEMARTLEVGRAVLASSKYPIELWLTTLITISPTQHSIDIQQLSSRTVLSILSSGRVWVHRGNGLRLQLEITLRGEPLPHQQLQELTYDILSAPVWAQLNLEPTLSDETAPDGDIAYINVNYGKGDGTPDEKECHRIFCNVRAADAQPPEGISRYQLQSVHFSMDVLEPKPRSYLKRAKTSPVEHSADQREYEGEYDGEEESELMLDELAATGTATVLDKSGAVSLAALPAHRKRRRPRTHAPTRTASTPPLPSIHGIDSSRKPAKVADLNDSPPSMSQGEELAEIHLMVDGAMRLSIYGVSKAPSGLKVKANTFGVGLADVAPILFRPGYQVALSRRAHLLPTITRSFNRIANVRVTSVSLREKVKRMLAYPSKITLESQRYQDITADEQPRTASPSTSNHFWLNLQRSLANKPPLTLQSFLARNDQIKTQSNSDEILEQENSAREVSGFDTLGIECHESACPADDKTTQQMTPLMSPTARANSVKNHKDEVSGYKDTIAEIESDMLIEAPPTPAETLVDDSQGGTFDILRDCSKVQPRSPEVSLCQDRVNQLSGPEHVLPTFADAEPPLDEDLDLLFNDHGVDSECDIERLI